MAGNVEITIDVACRKCGGPLETKDAVRTKESPVTCKACGAVIGTYGEIDAERRRLAKVKGGEIFNTIRKAFARLGH